MAGIGSRFFAVVIDTIIQYILMFAFVMPFSVWNIQSLGDIPERLDLMPGVYLALLLFFMFLINFGYFIFFEFFWDGQTPGKRIMGIKVRRVGGYPVNFISALLRNLLRIVDVLPLFYVIGFITAFSNASCRRIGDWVGGTIVVREGRKRPPSSLELEPEIDEDQIRINLGGTLPVIDESDIRPVREFIRRQKQFSPKIQEQLSREILQRLLPRFGRHQLILADGEATRYLKTIYRWYQQERLNEY
jgi:uncharacterized RDD family membrane protein YckC